MTDQGEVIRLSARTRHEVVPCPKGGTPTARVHSFHERTVADLPVDGRRVAVSVRVRRLARPVLGCPRQTRRDRSPDCWSDTSAARPDRRANSAMWSKTSRQHRETARGFTMKTTPDGAPSHPRLQPTPRDQQRKPMTPGRDARPGDAGPDVRHPVSLQDPFRQRRRVEPRRGRRRPRRRAAV
ncbi:transposase family protein (plasmid) [Streptomyces sp. NBC_01136]|nr:transposase family protein [Streptomyces sp. NBC_01136]